MTKLIIDGNEIDVPPGDTLLQACEAAGAEIPRFCFHERLSIAGNCRMRLVELSGSPKPVGVLRLGRARLPSGAEGRAAGSEDPHAAGEEGARRRDGIPADQPSARLPDLRSGRRVRPAGPGDGLRRRRTRYHENKRAVEDKYIGVLVKTIMNRCIHCTRCVRFATEVAGVPELGAIGRGEDMEITTYLESAMTSELQGNVVDLCPVGALTSKPYAFAARPWELNKTESIDVMDALGSAIRVDTRGREVMRILPRVNEDVNEEWISDKTRHVVDGLRTQRLDQPYIREGGRLVPATWSQAFAAIAAKVKAAKPDRIGAIAGDLAAVEEMFALKELMGRLGVDEHRLPPGRRGARSVARPRELSVQRDHRRHRSGRRHHDHRRQSAQGSAGAQCAHPQALARREPEDRRDRREGRSHL